MSWSTEDRIVADNQTPKKGFQMTRYEVALTEAEKFYDVEDQIRAMEKHDIARGEAMELLESASFKEGQ